MQYGPVHMKLTSTECRDEVQKDFHAFCTSDQLLSQPLFLPCGDLQLKAGIYIGRLLAVQKLLTCYHLVREKRRFELALFGA